MRTLCHGLRRCENEARKTRKRRCTTSAPNTCSEWVYQILLHHFGPEYSFLNVTFALI